MSRYDQSTRKIQILMMASSEADSLCKKTSRKPPWLWRFRSSKAVIVGTVCVAIFTDAFIYGVVVPVFPFSLRDRSAIPENEVQKWNSLLFGIYGAAILVGSPFFGWFADRSTSRRTPLMIGLLALGSATIMSCVGKSVYILLFSRMLQGVSSAAVYAVGLALLVDTVGRDEVGHWMGFALSSSSIGLVISPVLGGIVYSRAGYYAVFGMILGLIVFDILLRMLMIEKKSVEQWEIQIANHNYSTFSSDDSTQHNVSKSDVREEEGERERAKGPSHWLSVVGMIKNGHLHHKIVSVSRDLPPIFTLLRSPHVLTAIYGVFVQVTILVSFDATLPLFVERKFGWDSMKAGLVFLNLAVPALGGPLAGWLSDRYGPRWVAITGCLLTTPLLVLLRVVDGNVPFHVWLLCGFLILIGTTLTLIISPLAAELSLIVERIEHDRPEFLGNASGAYGQAFALFNCSVAAATLAGPVVADFIESRFGWECMTWMLAIFCASGAVPVFFFTSGRRINGLERSSRHQHCED